MNNTVQNSLNNIPQVFLPDLQIIRKPEALKMLGISKSNFHNKINAGLLPTAISLGQNAVGYFKHELTIVLLYMAAEKTQEDIKILVVELIEQRKKFIL